MTTKQPASVASWVIIVVSVVIAFSGIIFGILTSQTSENKNSLRLLEIRTSALEAKYERIDERLSNIVKLLEMHAEVRK
jgi:hypothetical protein